MPDLDMAAVCLRHFIYAWPQQGTDWWLADDRMTGVCPDPFRGKTQADAVCALLKARWRITVKDIAGEWLATYYDWVHFASIEYGPTEIAAVVALADRIAGVEP